MKKNNSKNIVFVTGAFIGNNCWDEWSTYFESKGYKTIAPPWPFKDATVQELRNRRPNDTDLAELTLKELIEHYAHIVESFPEKPIVIGHSIGGLITQILVNRDLTAAGVAIHSFPPHGIFPYEFNFLWAGRNALGLFTSQKETYMMSFKDWQFAFTNGMSLEEQKKGYEEFSIPESKTVVRGGLTSATKVDFDKKQAPLLITSGDNDHSIPAHINLRNFHKYEGNGSLVEYKEFPGRNHFVLKQPTWKEDADYILDWLDYQDLDNNVM